MVLLPGHWRYLTMLTTNEATLIRRVCLHLLEYALRAGHATGLSGDARRQARC